MRYLYLNLVFFWKTIFHLYTKINCYLSAGVNTAQDQGRR